MGGHGARACLHLDGRTQGGMQFGVLVLMVLWDAVCRGLFEVLVTVQAHVCILTVGCKGARSLGGGLGVCLGCWLIFARLTAGCLGGCCLGCSLG